MVEVEADVYYCNICNEKLADNYSPYGKRDRVKLISGLFNQSEFDVHDKCVNSVVREAFRKYFEPPQNPDLLKPNPDAL